MRRAAAFAVSVLLSACGGTSQPAGADSSGAAGQDVASPGLDARIELADAAAPGEDASAGLDASLAGPDAGEADAEAAGPDASTPDGSPPAAIALTGCAPSYTTTVRLASQQLTMMIDTGSTSLVVASAACPDCVSAGIKPLYTPGSLAVDEQKTAQSGYASVPPVGWTAEVWQDTVSVAGVKPSVRVDLAAVTSFQGPIFQLAPCGQKNAYQGILGLGPATLAVAGTTGYLDQLAATGAMPDLFAVQLCKSGGNLWVGGFDSSFAQADVQFTPMLKTGTAGRFYGVTVSDMKVGGAALGLPASVFGSGFVDTGSTAFFLPAQVYAAVTAAITSDPTFAQLFGDKTFFDDYSCTSVAKTKAELDAALPRLTVVLGPGPTITLDSPATESYLEGFDDGTGGVSYCPGIQKSPASSVKFDLGAPIMRGKLTVFDRAGQRIGFAPARCPND